MWTFGAKLISSTFWVKRKNHYRAQTDDYKAKAYWDFSGKQKLENETLSASVPESWSLTLEGQDEKGHIREHEIYVSELVWDGIPEPAPDSEKYFFDWEKRSIEQP